MKKFWAPLLLSLLTVTACTAAPPPLLPAPNQPAPATPGGPGPECQAGEMIGIDSAYVFYASGYRMKYYQFGRTDTANSVFGIEDRYAGSALEVLRQQTASWPAEVSVSIPGINISGHKFNADCSQVEFDTHETWLVKSPDGTVLYEESNQPHHVTMVQADGLLGQKWVVTEISGL